jgi:hypothetical protein
MTINQKRKKWKMVIEWIKKEAGSGFCVDYTQGKKPVYVFQWTREFEKEIGGQK